MDWAAMDRALASTAHAERSNSGWLKMYNWCAFSGAAMTLLARQSKYQTPGTSLLIRAAKLKSFCWHLTPLWDFADANFSHDITSSPYRYCSLPLSK